MCILNSCTFLCGCSLSNSFKLHVTACLLAVLLWLFICHNAHNCSAMYRYTYVCVCLNEEYKRVNTIYLKFVQYNLADDNRTVENYFIYKIITWTACDLSHSTLILISLINFRCFVFVVFTLYDISFKFKIHSY